MDIMNTLNNTQNELNQQAEIERQQRKFSRIYSMVNEMFPDTKQIKLLEITGALFQHFEECRRARMH